MATATVTRPPVSEQPPALGAFLDELSAFYASARGEGSRDPAPGTRLPNLDSEGTTVYLAPKTGEFWSDLDHQWEKLTRPTRQALRYRARRAAKLAKCMLPYNVGLAASYRGSQRWASSRATTMALKRSDVVSACGGRARTVRCACGDRLIPVGCDQTMLCGTCRARECNRRRKQIARGLDAALRASLQRWARGGARGMRPEVQMMTCTIPHSGNLVDDRRRLGKAWRELYKRSRDWMGAFAATWEATPGTAGDGHVHLHAAIVVDGFVPWSRVAHTWRKLVPGGLHPKFTRSQRRDSAGACANYLAKYVTKGVETSEFTGEKAAELLVAFRGMRKVTTSAAFNVEHRRPCDECGEFHVIAAQPVSFRKHVLLTAWTNPAWWLRSRPPTQKPLNLTPAGRYL